MLCTIKLHYIKASFKSSIQSKDYIARCFTKRKNILIGFSPSLKHVKITLMGKNMQYVNLTGAKSLTEVNLVFNEYILNSKSITISYPRVDSISAGCKFNRRRLFSFEDCRVNLSTAGFIVNDHSIFNGVTIRKCDDSRKVCTLFQTGSLNFIGFKHYNEINKMNVLILKCILKTV